MGNQKHHHGHHKTKDEQKVLPCKSKHRNCQHKWDSQSGLHHHGYRCVVKWQPCRKGEADTWINENVTVDSGQSRHGRGRHRHGDEAGPSRQRAPAQQPQDEPGETAGAEGHAAAAPPVGPEDGDLVESGGSVHSGPFGPTRSSRLVDPGMPPSGNVPYGDMPGNGGMSYGQGQYYSGGYEGGEEMPYADEFDGDEPMPFAEEYGGNEDMRLREELEALEADLRAQSTTAEPKVARDRWVDVHPDNLYQSGHTPGVITAPDYQIDRSRWTEVQRSQYER
ncbi:hypothetical protein J7T55_009881 [Diaporthe amygdali]|uniref:uncharacterized protein n=1 Tax=Phomopsis amygdali TaxID=1214568 RepID=UPI0022FF2C57|nr:uncharacterized protein J7T55_009881 [Diaporthe amygdali]KAJ0116731.1 hypothetical protein J7T55_009881 [Diaporthe amygdali]